MAPDLDLNRAFSPRSATPTQCRWSAFACLPGSSSLPRVLICLWLLLAALPVRADEGHDRARDALRAGEIVPLDEVLEVLRERGAGQVLEVELERHDDRWIYEIETLDPGGVIAKHVVDATTKEILKDGSEDED